jgi:hypothetical protein
MKPEQQRIAIAEACGWKLVTDNPCYEPYWENPTGNMIAVSCGMRLPDYLNDLNAVREAEKVLKEDSEAAFRGWLWLAHGQPEMRCKIIHATAAQRAEAFLRTLNLWKP